MARTPLMVPQGEEPATLALIMATLRGLDDRLASQNAASAEDRKLLHDIHIRVVQIESNQVQRRVEALAVKVDELESERDRSSGTATEIANLKAEVKNLTSDRDQRTGATNLFSWVFKNWPGVMGYAAMIGVLLKATGKI